MKSVLRYLLLLTATATLLSSCSYNRSPEGSSYDQEDPGYNYEFEGDMYFSTPYDPLSQWNNHYVKVNKDSLNQRMPAKGSIARNKSEYIFRYSNDVKIIEQERTRAAKEISFPMAKNTEIVEKGKIAYLKYCQQCHGAEGEGDGPVVKSGAFPGPSWKTYKSDYIKQLPVGQMYFSITYGKGLMGAHGSIVTPEERWNIIHYIKDMAGAPGSGFGVGSVASNDSTSTPKNVAD
jgi:mono/diheme cytochrome c family protein